MHITGPQDPNYGHFQNQEAPHMQGYPPGGFPPGGNSRGFIPPGSHPPGHGQGGIPPMHKMNPEMGGQNMPMDNRFHQPTAQQFPGQQVPFPIPPMPPQIPAQFHPGMQQNVMPRSVPMVPMQVPSSMKAPAEHIGITPEQKKEWESAYGNKETGGGKAKKKKFVRVAGGVVWEDTSLADWDPSKFSGKLSILYQHLQCNNPVTSCEVNLTTIQ